MFAGMSSMLSDSLPTLSVRKEKVPMTRHLEKLFDSLKTLCLDNVDIDDHLVTMTPKSIK